MKKIETGLLSRRIFLRRFLLAVGLSLLPSLFRTSFARAALPPLPNLPENEALLLTPADQRFWRYSAAYNRRTMVQPKLRAVCKTPTSVSAIVNCAAISFHLRCEAEVTRLSDYRKATALWSICESLMESRIAIKRLSAEPIACHWAFLPQRHLASYH